MDDTLIRLCAASDVAEGAALKVEVEDLTVAVFNLGGKFFVIDDQCTHGPGSLSEGCVDGEEIECDFHNGRFHIPTGAVTGPPCMIPVQTWTVRIVDGDVCIERIPPPLAPAPDFADAPA
jgi:nitrite reductase/ring-hydroxylating ferredoxin subunit